MDPERWQRIQEIFLEALELPEREISGHLDRACGQDAELRREVEALLDSDRNFETNPIAGVVQEAAVGFSSDNGPAGFSYIGRRIGHYQIVREIGHGGMGAVYQAVRVDDQYQHSVAIKLIPHGIDTPDALARFRTERQILATLQHPGIASLLDGGTTEEGRPYIVMEYIEGEPLIAYCRRRNLSVPERLQLFCSLCAAVHHAHQMMVIHRDIKPGNVLVTKTGIPKLLDFGIAKLLGPEVGDVAAVTLTGERMLTPRYASPEQVRGEMLTSATDIYSLGVLLYEMLTFASPYKVTGQSPQEVQRAVCETEPQRLSLAVRDDPRLRRQLAGDLETIVAMALRKEPQRRYASVQQFAEDIQRYLKGFPVTARDDTLFYVAGKLVRRNKVASAAVALLVLSVIAGWTATIREARRTQVRFQEVRRLANAILFDFHQKIQHLPGSTPVREYLVRTALEYLNNLSKDAADDISMQWELSQAYEQVGDAQGDPDGPNLGQFREALTSYSKALDLVGDVSKHRRDYETLSCMAWLHYKCGDLQLRTAGVKEAIDSYARGLQVASATTNFPKTDDLLMNGYQRLAVAHLRLADSPSALENARQAAAAADRVMRNRGELSSNLARTRLLLGNILWLRGDLKGAWGNYEQAVTWLEQLVRKRPDNNGHLQELEEAYRRSGDLQGNPAFFHFDDLERARFYHTKSLELAEQLAARDSLDAQAQANLSVALRRFGAVSRYSDPQKSAQCYRRAIGILEQLMSNAPGDSNYRRDLANSRLGLSHPLRAMQQYKEAMEELTAALAMQHDLLAKFPERLVVHEDAFDAQLATGELRLELKEVGPAMQSFRQALSTAQFLMERNSDSLYSERCMALVARRLGDYYVVVAARSLPSEKGRHIGEARQWYGKALAIWSRWREKNLAVPYSVNREREVREAIAGLNDN